MKDEFRMDDRPDWLDNPEELWNSYDPHDAGGDPFGTDYLRFELIGEIIKPMIAEMVRLRRRIDALEALKK